MNSVWWDLTQFGLEVIGVCWLTFKILDGVSFCIRRIETKGGSHERRDR